MFKPVSYYNDLRAAQAYAQGGVGTV